MFARSAGDTQGPKGRTYIYMYIPTGGHQVQKWAGSHSPNKKIEQEVNPYHNSYVILWIVAHLW